MSRHNRSRGPATRAKPAPPPRPPREAAPALTVLRPDAAGIDVHSDMHMVCVPAASVPPATGDGGLPANVRRFGANSCDLHAIADWLKACGVTTVAMESTGVYWVPLFELLEARGFEVWLVEPGQLSRCGARPKTDVLDAQWIQRLHSYGLLQPSFRPADSVLALRGYHRQRQMLVRYAAGHTLHMQKALEQMNVKLAEVVSDITGADRPADHRRHPGGRARPAGAGGAARPEVQERRGEDRQGPGGDVAARAPVRPAAGLRAVPVPPPADRRLRRGDPGRTGQAARPRRRQDRRDQAAAVRTQAQRPVVRRLRPAVPGAGRGPDGGRGDRRGHGPGDPGGDRRGREPVPDGEALRQLAGGVPAAAREQRASCR